MNELTPKTAMREEFVKWLQRHFAAAQSIETSPMTVLGLVTDPSHRCFLRIGEVVNQGWYGEGGTTICFGKDSRESLGGEMSRGGVTDAEVWEFCPDLLAKEDIAFLKRVCLDPDDLLPKI